MARYVLFALQVVEDEGGNYYEITHPTETEPASIQVPEARGVVIAEQGGWRMVQFWLQDLRKLLGMGAKDAGFWLSSSNNFIAADYVMIAMRAALGETVLGTSFTYDLISDKLFKLEWWDEATGEKMTGGKGDWETAGHPKAATVLPMPHLYGFPY